MLPPQPRSTLFPYTTLFRSGLVAVVVGQTQVVHDLVALGILRVVPEQHLETLRRRDRQAVAQVEVADLPLVLGQVVARSEEHTSELQSRRDLVCRLLLEKKN